jgi:hypothetical protein
MLLVIHGYIPVKSLDNALFTPNLALQHDRMVLLTHTPLGFISYSGNDSNIHLLSILPEKSSVSISSPSSFSCDHCGVYFKGVSAGWVPRCWNVNTKIW